MIQVKIDNLIIHDLTDLDFPYVLISEISGLDSPLIRTNQFNRTGEHGVIFSNSLYGERRLTLSLAIIGDADYETERSNLISAFSVKRDSNGYLIPKVLQFTRNDGKVFQIQVAPVGTPQFRRVTPRYSECFIDLLATNYIIESAEQYTAYLTPYQGGGTKVPFVLPVALTAGSSGDVLAINNLGNWSNYPRITFTGPLTNPALENLTTGESIALTYSLPAGGIIQIDCASRSVLAGNTNLYQYLGAGSVFWGLEPGVNNLRLTSSAYDTGSAKIEYRYGYIGI